MHNLKLGVLLVNGCHNSFTVYCHTFLGCHLCENHIYRYFVHAIHELFSFPSSVGELGVMCIPYKFYFKYLDAFPLMYPSGTCVCVLTVLSFYAACFCFDLIVDV